MTTIFSGEQYTLKQSVSGMPIGASYGRRTIAKGTLITVTKVGTESVWVRGASDAHGGEDRTLSIYFSDSDTLLADWFEPLDPNAPRPRRLGEAPEGAISVDDPRIQWLFDDMATYATKKQWCPTYDKLMDDLGLPGRPKEFTISETINGFTVSKKYTARSKAEAKAQFDLERTEVIHA